MSGGSRVPRYPENVRKMIQSIKEITRNDIDEEIYATLKECSMDPNEATQKLLLQDTFHEVKRKRDKKKESGNNPEQADSRRRSGSAGQGSRGGRSNYSSRYGAGVSGGRISKESGTNQTSDKSGTGPASSSFAAERDTKSRVVVPGASAVTIVANGPVGKSEITEQISSMVVGKEHMVSASVQSHGGTSKDFSLNIAAGDSQANVKDNSIYVNSGSLSGVYSLPSDPLLVRSVDSSLPVVGGQRTPVDPSSEPSTESKSNASKAGSKSYGVGKSQHLGFTQSFSLSTHGSSSSSRPSSNYGSRTHQTMGSQKGSSKEWKPKSANASAVQGPQTLLTYEERSISVEGSPGFQVVESGCDSKDAAAKLQKDLENLHVRDSQHVIIPTEIHVPESVRCGLSFGSFDAAFSTYSSSITVAESEKYSKPTSDCSQGAEVTVGEPIISNDNGVAPAEEGESVENRQPSEHAPEDVDTSSSSVLDMNDSQQEVQAAASICVTQTSTYGFGVMPNLLGNTVATFDGTETHARDAFRVPGIVHPAYPSTFYGQFYRSGTDGDGHLSPFPPSGVASKYNANATILLPQTSQSPEGGNSLMLSTVGEAPLVTQATGVMENSIPVTQPVPIFRQPTGVHLSHYPANYFPYGPYCSPFVFPQIHQYVNNSAFPQQHQVGGVYPAQASAAATGLKFPIPQYKPGTNIGNTVPIGAAGNFGPYGSTPAGYNPGSAAVSGNPAGNDDLAASQFKENNVYINGQQSEGSAVWVATPGRDLSSMQPNSFYNLSPHGQVTFPPSQAAHGTFAGVYHPAQAVMAGHPLLQQSQPMGGAVDMTGATMSVYEQPQHTRVNWPNTY